MAGTDDREHRVRIPDQTWHRMNIVAAVLKRQTADLVREVLDAFARKAVYETRYPAEPREGRDGASGSDGSDQPDADQPGLFGTGAIQARD